MRYRQPWRPFDNPHGKNKGKIYRWFHHMWILSFNRNEDLYRVVWWSKFTRPLLYDSSGRIRGDGSFALFYGAFFILIVIFVIFR